MKKRTSTPPDNPTNNLTNCMVCATGLKYRLLKKLYTSNRLTQKIFERYIAKYEGGQYTSGTLRKIFSELYDINVGYGTYGCFSYAFRSHITIGNYCSIANGVQRLVGNHPMDMFSTHPFFHLKRFGYVKEDYYISHHLTIGNDVWIGTNAIILGKVEHIGDGAVIGAGSIVTHDVPPYAVVAGNPAKIIKYRFDEEMQRKLTDSKWYNYNPGTIISNYTTVDHLDEFISNFEVNTQEKNCGSRE